MNHSDIVDKVDTIVRDRVYSFKDKFDMYMYYGTSSKIWDRIRYIKYEKCELPYVIKENMDFLLLDKRHRVMI
jgi:hypothetical protein